MKQQDEIRIGTKTNNSTVHSIGLGNGSQGGTIMGANEAADPKPVVNTDRLSDHLSATPGATPIAARSLR